MAQHKTTFGGVWAFPDGISARATGIHDVVGAAMLGAPMRAGLPYLAAIPIVGAAMIAASWLIAAERNRASGCFWTTRCSATG